MKTLLYLEIEGLPPTVNHTYRTGKNYRYKIKEVKEWQEYVTLLMKSAKRYKNVFKSPVALNIIFNSNNLRRWDIDNRVKALQDCLAPAGIIEDDSQVWKIQVERNLKEMVSTTIILTEHSIKNELL